MCLPLDFFLCSNSHGRYLSAHVYRNVQNCAMEFDIFAKLPDAGYYREGSSVSGNLEGNCQDEMLKRSPVFSLRDARSCLLRTFLQSSSTVQICVLAGKI